MSQGMTPEQESDSISHASLDSDPGAEPDRVPHLPVQRGATGILTAGSEALDPKQVQLVADVIARWERPFKDAPKGAPALRDCSYLFKWGTPVQRVDNTIIRTIDCLSSKIESAALVAQSGFAPGTLPSILLVFDRLYDDVIVDTAAAYYLAKIADKEPYLMPSWINAVRELRDTPGEAAERRAAALEREVRIKVSEHICTSFPSKRFVGQVEPDLGLALSRVAGTREEAQILSDVLMKRGAFKAKLHTQIDQLVQGYPFASRSAVSRSMSDARNQLCKLLGWCELPTVNVGVHLERPLAYDSSSRTLNFDLSLLAIEENSRVALIESSINHMHRRSIYCSGSEADRELAAYFDGAADLLSRGPLFCERLRSAFVQLGSYGWQSGPYLHFLNGVDAALDREVQYFKRFGAGVSKAQQEKQEQEADIERRSFRPKDQNGWIQFKSALHPGGKFSAIDLVQTKCGELSPKVEALSKRTGHVAVMRSDAVLLSECGELPQDQSIELLSRNPFLLYALRIGYRERARAALRSLVGFMLPDRLAEDLSSGRASLVYECATQRGTAPQKLNMLYRRACWGHQFFEIMIGTDRLRNILSNLSQEERETLLLESPAGRLNVLELEDVMHNYLSSILENRAPIEFLKRKARKEVDSSGIGLVVQRLKQGQARDGVSYLRWNLDPTFILNLIRNIGLGSIHDPAVPLTENVELARRQLLGAVLERWGLPLGLLLRNDSSLRDELLPFSEDLQQACWNAKDRVRGADNDIVREASSHLGRVLVFGTTAEDLAAYAVGIEAALPELLDVELASSSLHFNVERAALRTLAQGGPSPELNRVARIVGSRLLDMPQLTSTGFEYARVLYPHVTISAALSPLLRVLILHGGELTDERGQSKSLDYCSVFEQMDDKLRKKVILNLTCKRAEFAEIMRATTKDAVKAYILRQMPEELLGDHLASLEVDQMRMLLAGIDTELLKRYVSKHRGRDRSRDAVVREVYSQHITSYPDMVDHYENMVDVPNYFKVLGVPRSASREQVQESYRQLAFAFHPDRFGFEREGGSERASEMIKLLAEARSVLYDSANRSEYQRNIPNDVNLYPTESWVEHLPQG